MAANSITVATSVEDVRTIFNDVEEVYYTPSTLKASDITTGVTNAMEFPVLNDGVGFDTGSVDVSEVKLTTGKIWTTKSEKGDADINFQVAAVDDAINDIFLNKVAGKGITTAMSISAITGASFKGDGYSLAPKKVTGALILPSADRQTCIILPSVEMFGSLVLGDGDNPAYYNVTVKPIANGDGVEIYILKQATA